MDFTLFEIAITSKNHTKSFKNQNSDFCLKNTHISIQTYFALNSKLANELDYITNKPTSKLGVSRTLLEGNLYKLPDICNNILI